MVDKAITELDRDLAKADHPILRLVTTTKSAIPITTGILGGNVVAVKL